MHPLHLVCLLIIYLFTLASVKKKITRNARMLPLKDSILSYTLFTPSESEFMANFLWQDKDDKRSAPVAIDESE